MHKIVTTKYAGPTNTRGARVIAKTDTGRVTVAWSYETETVDNHRAAAVECVRYQADGYVVNADRVVYGGRLPDGTGYVWIVGVTAV